MNSTADMVSLPYGFTLFSNNLFRRHIRRHVSLPYGFTLFSNDHERGDFRQSVSLPYGFTLFSNNDKRFNPREYSFTTLWIYTILKHGELFSTIQNSFTTLWIYTILKLQQLLQLFKNVSLPYGFTLFSNRSFSNADNGWFHYLMDLHYSQTTSFLLFLNNCFTTLWIYTILKQGRHHKDHAPVSLPYGFTLFSNICIAIFFYISVSLPYGFTLFSN